MTSLSDYIGNAFIWRSGLPKDIKAKMKEAIMIELEYETLELKRKVNSLLRLADETNLLAKSNNDVIDKLQKNINFKGI